MNSTTISRAGHRPLPFVVVALVAITSFGCGNESINVLTTRDAGAEPDTNDPARDAFVDLSADATPDLSMDTTADLSMDATVDLSVDTSVDLPGPTDAPISGCRLPGLPCSIAGECCSLSCRSSEGKCASDPVCAPADNACESNADCCSNYCEGKRCLSVTPPRCRPAGELCALDQDCCGARCTPGTGGLTRCALLGDCRVVGEICVTHSECCSGRCEADDTKVRRVCIAATPCGVGGNMCRGQANDRCDSDQDCCTGGCAPGAGPPRCSSPACGGLCAHCSEDRDCCTGTRCPMGDESGYWRCE